MNNVKHQVITLMAARYIDKAPSKGVCCQVKDSGEEDKSKRGI